MNRDDFFLVLEKVARVLPREEEVVVIGSQAAHAWARSLPDEILLSREVDVAPIDDQDEEKAYRINFVAGELSDFDEEHDVYAEGVSLDLFVAPTGWLGRCKRLRVARPGAHDLVALCPDLHDLCIAKLMAGREQDHVFVRALVTAGLVGPDRLDELLLGTPATSRQLERARAQIAAARRAT